MKFQVLSVALLSTSVSVDAFNTSPNRAVASSAVRPLNVGATMNWNAQNLDEQFLMQQAEVCAHSESCTLEEAQKCLDDVLHVQSGCVGGTILGDVCDNVDQAVELVVDLRQRIAQKSQEAIVIGTAVNLAAVSVTMAAVAILASGLSSAHVDSTPFTLQEWWWAVRDGYLPAMIAQNFRHGGLASLDYDSATTAFTMQEWWWALKGGYLNTMTDHYFRNGGLATSEGFVPEAVPFTPNEWLQAAKGGYLDTMVGHNFQHGGLVADVESSLDIQATKLTQQEIFFAARDGYLGEFAQHVFRNGGV